LNLNIEAISNHHHDIEYLKWWWWSYWSVGWTYLVFTEVWIGFWTLVVVTCSVTVRGWVTCTGDVFKTAGGIYEDYGCFL
jgi:hypothetical protein